MNDTTPAVKADEERITSSHSPSLTTSPSSRSHENGYTEQTTPDHPPKVMTSGTAEELLKLLDAAGMVMGLRAQGHVPTVERMLAEGRTWDEIGAAIGWHGPTARDWYERFEKDPFESEQAAPVEREPETARQRAHRLLDAMVDRLIAGGKRKKWNDMIEEGWFDLSEAMWDAAHEELSNGKAE